MITNEIKSEEAAHATFKKIKIVSKPIMSSGIDHIIIKNGEGDGTETIVHTEDIHNRILQSSWEILTSSRRSLPHQQSVGNI